jgi:hypothetical protein
MFTSQPRRTALATLALLTTLAVAAGWGAHGHRTITLLALDGLPESAPAFLRDAEVRRRIAEQAVEPDRWRGTRLAAMTHENDPEHYLDVELLEQFGLTLETVPPLRYDYLRAMAVAKHVHPEKVDPYDRRTDPAGSKEWPGFLPHAIAEHYAKLRSSFHTLRILEAVNDPARAAQLENARANVVYHMGMLSHFVADAAQPLHTTKHFNGWVGDNPSGYTTDRRFHALVDTDLVIHHGLSYDSLRDRERTRRRINAADPWDDCIAHIRRSFDQVEPLYRLERDGALRGPEGKALLEARFLDAADTVAALYAAAWRHSEPTEGEIVSFANYNPTEPAPGSSPARRRGSENP